MNDVFLQRFCSPKLRESRVGEFFKDITDKGLFEQIQGRKQIHLEIGCGHGHWLTQYACENPKQVFVGIDLNTKRIEKALSKARKHSTENLFFFKAEAWEFIRLMPSNFMIGNIFIMFPDPWPKKKHHKRRLIQDSFLDLLAEQSSSHSLLFFRTDDLAYFKWSKEKVSTSRNWRLIEKKIPFKHFSYFQDLLPCHQSFTASVKNNFCL